MKNFRPALKKCLRRKNGRTVSQKEKIRRKMCIRDRNKRILICASGRGSNAEALHEAAVDGTIKGMIVGVICDHHNALVLQRAERWKVPVTVIEMKTCRDKADYNEKIEAKTGRPTPATFPPTVMCFSLGNSARMQAARQATTRPTSCLLYTSRKQRSEPCSAQL